MARTISQALCVIVTLTCLALSSELYHVNSIASLGLRNAHQERDARSRDPTAAVSLQNQQQRGREGIENITWVGRQYFLPRGYKIFNPTDLKDLMAQYPILWIGDSTMRRAYLTLHLMLRPHKQHLSFADIEDNNFLKVNKQWNSTEHEWVDEVCEHYSNETLNQHDLSSAICRDINGTYSDFFGLACIEQTLQLLQNNPNVFSNYRIIVISLGLYDTLGRCDGGSFLGPEFNYSRPERLEARRQIITTAGLRLLEALSDLPNTLIIWRTNGLHSKPRYNRDTNQVNAQFRTWIRTNFSTKIQMVDWATAVYPRSIDKDRISGDNHYHYGHEARILFLQMLANTLSEAMDRSVHHQY
jgi:hypothetical protein